MKVSVRKIGGTKLCYANFTKMKIKKTMFSSDGVLDMTVRGNTTRAVSIY